MTQSKQFRFVYLTLFSLLILGAFSFALFYLNRNTATPVTWGAAGGVRDGLGDWLNAIFRAFVMPTVGGFFGFIILQKRTHQRIGWLILVFALIMIINFVFIEWTVFQFFTRSQPMAGASMIAWLTNWSWTIVYQLFLIIVAIFPNGAFFSKRWRLLIILSLTLFSLLTVALMIENPMHRAAFGIENLWGFGGSQSAFVFLFNFGLAWQGISTAIVLVEKIARFRQSKGKIREQMKWLLFGVGFSVIQALAGLFFALFEGSAIGAFIVNSMQFGLLLGMGIALWRAQLFDIDLVIRRTLIYSLLSGILAAVYFITVALIQSTITAVGGQPSNIVIVISTLLIAILFNPLRLRIQTLIDRRFYRSSYDAQATLARFAETARDEVEMERLTMSLLEVVQETMQPESVSVWLKPTNVARDT